jgi:outer membrane immunogenic protein
MLIKGASLMKTLISSVVLGALFTGSAIAADMRMPVKAPPAPPPPVYTWTGCYLGGGGGYGMFDHEHDVEALGVVVFPKVDTGGRGWFGTVQGGCDLQFNSFLPILGGSMIIGAFADGDWGNIKGTSAIGTLVGDEKLDQSWAAGARLGWLPTDRFLTFVSGGYTNAHLRNINYAFPPFAATLEEQGHRVDGWFIGTGYEYNLGWLPGLTWKTEYRFADYGSRTDTIIGLPSGTPAFTSGSHLFVQTLRSELVWRFNWGGYGAAPVMSRY